MPNFKEILTKIQSLETDLAERLTSHAGSEELADLIAQIKSLKDQINITCPSQITASPVIDNTFQPVETTNTV